MLRSPVAYGALWYLCLPPGLSLWLEGKVRYLLCPALLGVSFHLSVGEVVYADQWHPYPAHSEVPVLSFQRVLPFGKIRIVHIVGAVLSQLSKGSFLLSREVLPQGLGSSLQFGVCLYIKP